MALDKSIVSINMGQGIDVKDDEKVGDPGTYLELKDFTWNKLKRLDKRPGSPALPTTVSTSFPNPLTIGSSTIASSVFAHKDQLCLQNKGVLYSWDDQSNVWQFKGHYYPLETQTQTVVSQTQSIFRPSVSVIGDLLIYTYQTRSLNTFLNSFRYTVIDRSTGNYLYDDVEIDSYSDSNNLLTSFGYHGAGVVYFPVANRGYVIYERQGFLNIQEINVTTGQLSPGTALQTDAATDGRAIDFVYTNKAGVGERVFISYITSSGPNAKIFSITSAGAVDGTMGIATVSFALSLGTALHYNQTTETLYLGISDTGEIASIRSYTFTPSAITLGTSFTIGTYLDTRGESVSISAIAFVDDPLNLAQVRAYVHERRRVNFDASNVTVQTVPDDRIWQTIINASGSVGGSTIRAWGLALIGKPILDTNRQTVYLPCERVTDQQSAAFLVDVLRGKFEDAAFCVSRWNYLDHAGPLTPNVANPYLSPARLANINTSQWIVPTRIRTRVDNLQTFNQFVAGLCASTIDLAPVAAPSRQFFTNNTYLSGGHLSLYDGVQVCESNFFYAPEYMQLQAATSDQRAIVSIFQQGTAGLPEITDITLPAAPLVPNNAGGVGRYWTFNTPTTGYYVWYQITTETDPLVPGRTGIQVLLTGNETAFNVAKKTTEAIVASGAAVNFLASPATNNPGQFRMTNNANGSVTDAVGFNVLDISTGPPVGTYQYCAVWSWIDQSGQLHRSAPSIPASVTGTGRPIAVVIHTPLITNRQVSQVQVEIYRTQANLTTFYKVVSFDFEKSWSLLETSVAYRDATLDAFLVSSATLYTSGGILENTQLGPCKALSVFKNRLLASGQDNNTLYYSKTAINSEPADFTQEMFIRTDNDGQPIVGHAQLDDKLVIFKESQIEYRAGDGANDLGVGSSFSLPILVATDTGCINPNTIAIYPNGLFFQSKLGIQAVNRSMQVEYIGLPVESFNSNKVARSQVLLDDANVREIRFILQDSTQSLVYDYLVGRWGVFTQYGGTDAALWRGDFVRVDASGVVWREDRTVFEDTGAAVANYNPTLVTQWLKIKNVQDFQRIYRLSILGNLKSGHTLNFKIYYDYDNTNFDEYNFASSNIAGAQPGDTVYQPQIHLKRQKCQSVKIEMAVVTDGTGSKECLTLTDMSFQVGVKRGLNKVRAAKKL